MLYDETYLFHNKNIKTPLIWGLFYKIEDKYKNFIYFIKYKYDKDYYTGFSNKSVNRNKISYKNWMYIVEDIQKLLSNHNYKAYDKDTHNYIEMNKYKFLKDKYGI